jgi:ketosteroid isomerase-like protein
MTSPKDVTPEVDSAVRRLVARYCHLVDDGDYDAAAELFTDDARYVALGKSLEGRDAIKAMLVDQGNHSTLTQVSNIVVSNGSHAGTFHAVADLTVSAKVERSWTQEFVGRFHDTFVGEGRQMRFSQRILTAR